MHFVVVSPRASVTVSEDFIMRILVADDEPEMVMVLEALLKREHYSVDAVYNGQDALDYGLGGNYACIVLDIMMPKLDAGSRSCKPFGPNRPPLRCFS